MTGNSIILVGGPDSGKTNYLARLWCALTTEQGHLVAPEAPDKIGYVESLLAHLLQGSFAPRSATNLDEGDHDLTITVAEASDLSQRTSLVVPDVLGELWKNLVVT